MDRDRSRLQLLPSDWLRNRRKEKNEFPKSASSVDVGLGLANHSELLHSPDSAIENHASSDPFAGGVCRVQVWNLVIDVELTDWVTRLNVL